MPQYAAGVHEGTTASATCTANYLANTVAVYPSRREAGCNRPAKDRRRGIVQTALGSKLLQTQTVISFL